MFSKNTDKLESFVGINSHFKGDIKSKGTVRVDGTVEGDVEADWLILGEKASIRGNVASRGIIVGGKIEGIIHAKEIIEIKNKGQVIGDINTARLTVSEGGLLEGRSSMHMEDSNVVELQLKTKG